MGGRRGSGVSLPSDLVIVKCEKRFVLRALPHRSKLTQLQNLKTARLKKQKYRMESPSSCVGVDFAMGRQGEVAHQVAQSAIRKAPAQPPLDSIRP